MSILDERKIRAKSAGRINIIGEHTDYNDGYVLPAAVDKNITFEISRNNTLNRVEVAAKNVNEHFTFNLDDFEALSSGWQNHVMGMVSELQKLNNNIAGFEAFFEGDIPIGGGMSSSAALEASLGFALNALFKLQLEPLEIIKAAQRAEHNFVGIKCGIMDMFASVMGKKDHALLLDCRSLEYEYIPIQLGNYEMVLLNSNVSHSLASTAYNTRRAECFEGVGILQKKYPKVEALRDASLDMLKEFQTVMPANIYKRCLHVITENDRVLKACEALKNDQLSELGQLMNASHLSLQYDYEVSCPELDFLAASAMDKSAVLGSRMMGGGFGGCTINLIHKEYRDQFIEETSKAYHLEYGTHLTPYIVSIEDGAVIF